MLRTKENTTGSYNNFSHLDHIMYLHMHLAYLKFGFGRATTDASIDVKMETGLDKAKQLKNYDHIFPDEYLHDYLEYFAMDKNEFFQVLESHRNHNIFEKKGDKFYLMDVI